ncbi:GNAT family N-acetyltransferase [Oleiagrimonas sp. MCCC 1A03011]|uniref:GNAT family N-acetyltransferase n=1 Tax=Oleiagrimonas sp. MCCC 1A03011 TaxID=1926883 RepID=UPI000DC60533|nr:GNAT family N-acetyltransferase [Oleiagrimonas sp. MCCC 1A03011]RAP57367.1 GNAT family N-acetyltransferase [Oleiagrimonas sp. MCCC 1A03011]
MSMVNVLRSERIVPVPAQATPLPPRGRARFGQAADESERAKGEQVRLDDGRTLYLRPIRPDDVDAVRRCFTRLHPDEVRMRFMQAMRELPLPLARRLCTLNPAEASAYVLMDETCNPAELRGVGRIHLDAATHSAEFAVLVERAWTGKGLGHLLMLRLIEECKRRGLEEIWGYVLVDNRPMLDLCRELGFRHRLSVDDPGMRLLSLALDGASEPVSRPTERDC